MQVEHLSNTRKWLLDYPVFHIDLEDTLTFVKDVSNNIVNNNPYTDIILVGTGLSGAMLCSSIATYIYTYLDFRWNIGVQILRKPEDNNNRRSYRLLSFSRKNIFKVSSYYYSYR